MNSLWRDTAKIDAFPTLDGDIKTDVLIIGGGIAGILCARLLHDAGVPYMLVEQDTIGGGITQNTTAKITSQHGLIYHKLLHNAGLERAKMYLEANQRAVEQYRSLCAGMDCDFEEKDAYVYSMRDRGIIESEMSALQKIGFHAEFIEKIPLPFRIAGAVKFPFQAQFHPLKFLAHASKGLAIFERTRVKELAMNTAVTERGRITAKHMIVATHFPFLNKIADIF